MKFLEGRGNLKEKEAWAGNAIQTAFLEWLLLPETHSHLESILASVLDDKPLSNIPANITTPDVCPSPKLTDRLRSPTAIDDSTVYHRLESSHLVDSSELLARRTSPASAPVVPISPARFDTSALPGQIPRFWFPSKFRRAPAPESVWSTEVEERLLSVFGVSPPGGAETQAKLTIGFEDFQNKIVRDLLKLSRYMACNILCLIRGWPIEEHLAKVVASTLDVDDVHSSLADKDATLRISYSELQTQLNLDNDIWNFFSVVKDDDCDFIWGHNFQPFLTELLERHPGVEFLKPTPEFQKRYIDTVIARIMYDLDAMYEHKVMYSQLIKSCLTECWRSIDDEGDFNTIRDYFSYEHFYVAYCRFWNLDADHDFRLDKLDLVKYDNHAFSPLTLNRLFGESGTLISDGTTIGFEGFLFLLKHDEDKTTDRSIEFWFRILDLDGDGILSQQELSRFYSEQLVRLEARTMEAASFETILCQLNDMVRPEVTNEFRLRDLKRQRRHAPLFFNTLLSLTKFLAWEHRDPFALKTEYLEFPFFTDWDRFCHFEYEKLSTEDLSEEWDDFPGYMVGVSQDDQALMSVDSSMGRTGPSATHSC